MKILILALMLATPKAFCDGGYTGFYKVPTTDSNDIMNHYDTFAVPQVQPVNSKSANPTVFNVVIAPELTGNTQAIQVNTATPSNGTNCVDHGQVIECAFDGKGIQYEFNPKVAQELLAQKYSGDELKERSVLALKFGGDPLGVLYIMKPQLR